ncbi:cleavage and polyadenylation specificity factor subunit 6-like [Dendronephthya gigantea]|uniref:cleavage and polyadenylation specificity factor subunit 6-like n=1 Tax=Dendronephthya gigantea TaxID=151771 RepID=UPI00106DC3B4|nr:cleavage and polyadenylation specificity factor subunit 6-like [Dendronephthya gigantea]
MAGADIDLYAGVGELDSDLNQSGVSSGFGGDIYEDVLATSASQPPTHQQQFVPGPPEVSASGTYEYKSFTTIHPKSAQAQAAASQIPDKPKGKPLYVGNFTWWTTDQQLEDALQECGVTDIVQIKFFENRANGQSKGYALVELGSDVSVRLVSEKLPLREINGQTPVVTPATKTHLQQFEVTARKINPSLNSHQDNDAGAGRGFGRGFRGRGGMRPGMGRATELAPPDMAIATPWMPPGVPIIRGPPPVIPGMITPHGEKLPPGMAIPASMGGPPPPMGMIMPIPGDHGLPKPQVAPHFNPAFFPPEGAPPDPMMPGMVPPGPRFEGDFMARGIPPDMYGQFPRPGGDFDELTRQNQILTSNSIKKAMVDSTAGQHEIAIETLVQAISIIKQSPVAHEETSQILVQSLQDCLQGIEQQMISSSASDRAKSAKRESRRYSDDDNGEGERRRRKRRSRSGSRSRSRRSRSRDRRSRSRDREKYRSRR